MIDGGKCTGSLYGPRCVAKFNGTWEIVSASNIGTGCGPWERNIYNRFQPVCSSQSGIYPLVRSLSFEKLGDSQYRATFVYWQSPDSGSPSEWKATFQKDYTVPFSVGFEDDLPLASFDSMGHSQGDALCWFDQGYYGQQVHVHTE